MSAGETMRVVDGAKAKERLCGVELCEMRACLTLRVETDGGPQHMCFCMGHLSIARGILDALIGALREEGEPDPA